MNRHEHITRHLRDNFDSLNSDQRAQIYALIESSPARTPKAARDNVIVRFSSAKMRSVLVLDSHTVELTYALELELDSDVIAYYPQVACKGVRFGGHTRSGVKDFLVIRNRSVELVECKSHSDRARLLAKPSGEWVEENGFLINRAYGPWAIQHGMTHLTWLSPKFVAIRLRNLERIYNTSRQFCFEDAVKIADRLRSVILSSAKSMDWLMQHIHGFNLDQAAIVLGKGLLFGPIDHVPLTDIHDFFLCSTAQQVEIISHSYIENAVQTRRSLDSALATASAVDVEHAQRRLSEIRGAQNRAQPVARHLRNTAKRVQQAQQLGTNMLEACLTNYAASGNRLSRLSIVQEDETSKIIKRYEKGDFHSKAEAYAEFVTQCSARGEIAQSRQAFQARLNARVSLTTRALSVGGMRAYNKAKLRSDARFRSGKALAPHTVLHVDSTKLDVRIVQDNTMDTDCPLLYLGTDEATGDYMAHAYVFGPARRAGLAILIRNYVRRTGVMFDCLHIDRGTENMSSYLWDLSDRYEFSLRVSPTAASPFNSEAELSGKRVNNEISHYLLGSTEPDKAGRAVDGKHKSYRTARHVFGVVGREVERAIYGNFRDTPTSEIGTRRERMEEGSRLFPISAKRQNLDEEFLFLTSIPHTKNRYDRSKGFNVYGRYFNSIELMEAYAGLNVIEIRVDPEDPTFIWVKTNNGLFKAFCNLVNVLAHKTLEGKQFHAMYERATSSAKREERDLARMHQLVRTADANRSFSDERGTSPVNAPQKKATTQPKPGLSDADLRKLNAISSDEYEEIADI